MQLLINSLPRSLPPLPKAVAPTFEAYSPLPAPPPWVVAPHIDAYSSPSPSPPAQGRGPYIEADRLELNETYKHKFFLDDPIGGEHMNILKAGLETCHRLVAVSHGYAWECQTQDGGWGLDMVVRDNAWKLRGIVNGIDYNEWNPVRGARGRGGVCSVRVWGGRGRVQCACVRGAGRRVHVCAVCSV